MYGTSSNRSKVSSFKPMSRVTQFYQMHNSTIAILRGILSTVRPKECLDGISKIRSNLLLVGQSLLIALYYVWNDNVP